MRKQYFTILIPKKFVRGVLYGLIALSMGDHVVTLITGQDGDARANAHQLKRKPSSVAKGNYSCSERKEGAGRH